MRFYIGLLNCALPPWSVACPAEQPATAQVGRPDLLSAARPFNGNPPYFCEPIISTSMGTHPKGSLCIPKRMNFRKISKRPLTPAPFSEKILRFFPQTGCTSTKFAMKFFRSEMTPPLFEAFSGNSWPKLPFLKQKKLQWNFLDRKFSKKSSVLA